MVSLETETLCFTSGPNFTDSFADDRVLGMPRLFSLGIISLEAVLIYGRVWFIGAEIRVDCRDVPDRNEWIIWAEIRRLKPLSILMSDRRSSHCLFISRSARTLYCVCVLFACLWRPTSIDHPMIPWHPFCLSSYIPCLWLDNIDKVDNEWIRTVLFAGS